MKSLPCLFSGWSVQRILAGHKTQTRRISGRLGSLKNAQVGDELWVRETWFPDPTCDGTWPDVQFMGCKGASLDLIPERYRTPDHVLYRASWLGIDLVWRPSIFMPRWASRMTLRVLERREEPLHAITRMGAVLEGIEDEGSGAWVPVAKFAELWDELNLKRAPWASNPLVTVFTFELA